MKEIIEEFSQITIELNNVLKRFDADEIEKPLKFLDEAATEVSKSWSGSCLGYHSRVYYNEFKSPPPGAYFSSEWGFQGTFVHDTRGDWIEYKFDDVKNFVYKLAGNPDLTKARDLADDAREIFDNKRAELISSITSILERVEDSFLSQIIQKLENLQVFRSINYIRMHFPKGQFMTRDSIALSQGLTSPPHIFVQGEVMDVRYAAQACKELTKLSSRTLNHTSKKLLYSGNKKMVGNKVFIGHGRSKAWKDIKEFIQDRLKLEWDEFNRVPIAGITNITRLSQMLDEAGIAFLVLTAEDELSDGKSQARMNVIHEAGLFQGRLGFTRAIVLLKEGREEFSNIQGLGQIRFPKDKIKEVFDDIRQVLEREGILES
jgi:predicted nucleotide-binding protein